MIRRIQGSGTYVSHPSKILESGLEALESLDTIAQRSGFKVRMERMSVETRAAKLEEQRIFAMPSPAAVIQVARVILAEDQPAAYLIDILPAQYLTAAELTQDFTGSVLDLLLKRGDIPLLSSKTEINAAPASSTVAQALQIQRGVVLLCFTADLYTASAEVVSHSISYFVPGCFRFHVIRKVHEK
ncbi:MAG: GntR family transcriptional regulator [Anaerolineales bacterium]|nr:GntR family transcriptional regulator [Anaerolineales bacterium]